MSTNRTDRKLVVAGIVIEDDRVLISQRMPHHTLPSQWEFPGGKIEVGESPEIALVRELREELGIDVLVGRVWEVLFHAYPDFDVVLLLYPCLIMGTTRPQCLEVSDWAWVTPKQMDSYDFLRADRSLVTRLQQEGLPTPIVR